MKSRDTSELIRIGEAARHLGISVDTLRRWSNDGRVPVITLPSGQRRYRRADLDAVVRAGRAS